MESPSKLASLRSVHNVLDRNAPVVLHNDRSIAGVVSYNRSPLCATTDGTAWKASKTSFFGPNFIFIGFETWQKIICSDCNCEHYCDGCNVLRLFLPLHNGTAFKHGRR